MDKNQTAYKPCPICGGIPKTTRNVIRAKKVAVCGECGSWYRVPRPGLAELADIYDENYYNSWGHNKDESIAEATKHHTFTPIIRHLEQQRTHGREGLPRLLDVGAAMGALLEVAKQHGWDVYALELNPHAADVLRRRYGTDRVFEGELVDCTFPKGFFDVITMTDVIEHVLDIKGTLQTAVNLLRTGGILYITTPRIDTFSRVLMGSQWLHFKQEHIQYFSRRGIEQSLRKAGFSDIIVSKHWKYLRYDYLYNQLTTYPHWLLTPMISLAGYFLPRGLKEKAIGLHCGEMAVTARLTCKTVD